MKKIDLHIHTVATFRDAPFTFSLDTFERYVEEAKLHAVAVRPKWVTQITPSRSPKR